MTTAKLEARGLGKRYAGVEAVRNLNLTVQAGEIYGLLGPNGAGKTTALEMMEGLRRPGTGTAAICGFDTMTQTAEVRRRIGLSLQSANLPAEATVVELLRLYASFYPNPMPIGDLLRQFQLEEKVNSRCARLSGGQKQRLALALALVGRPEVVFLDEPTTGLDPQARHGLWEVILSLRSEGRAVIMSTHYMEEAERLCDRVGILDHGVLLAEGTPRTLALQYGPESALELSLERQAAAVHLAAIARLPAVTGLKSEENLVVLHTANTAATLMGLAAYAQSNELPLNDLRTRSATMEDVFMVLTSGGAAQ